MSTASVSSSATAATTYSSKGLSGLSSGLDTEALVEAMTSDVQAKIDKVDQQTQLYKWKQTAYREVTDALLDFEDSYLSYSSSTNLLSSNSYKTTTMVPEGTNADAISVTATSTTATPTYTITGISQLATKASLTSGGDACAGDITTGTISFGEQTVCPAAGGSISIKYGGSVYTVSLDEDTSALTASDMATALNEAMADVSISTGDSLADVLKFSASDEKLSLSFVDSTDSNSFSISGGTKTTLTALGFSAGDTPTSGTLTGSTVDLSDTVAFSLAGKSLTFDLNGQSETITFDNDDSASSISELQDLLQDKLDACFGENKIKVSSGTVADPTISTLTFKTVKDGGTVDDTSVLKITSSTSSTLGTSGIFNLKNGATNRLDKTDTIAALGLPATTDGTYTINVNGVSFCFDKDTEISTVLSDINGNADAGVTISFLSTTGKFSITADKTGAQGKVNIYDEDGTLAEALFGEDALYDAAAIELDPDADAESSLIKTGKDLLMTIKYEGTDEDVPVIRSSNSATIDGVTFTAKSTFETDELTTTNDEISFSSETDCEDLVKTIASMVSDYNDIVDLINTYVTTQKDQDYDYDPLTDAQKDDMTDDEIEDWEEKAKEGILFGDSTLTSLASNLRFIFATVVSGVGNASSIGITTSSDYEDNGKLVLDEEALTAAIELDPELVKNLFTVSTSDSKITGSGYLSGGIAYRLQNVMESYAKDTGSYKGKLVELAGIKNNSTTTDNFISNQLSSLATRLESLQELLETRQDRYQSKFTTLETYISQMNSQSSWLTSSTSS